MSTVNVNRANVIQSASGANGTLPAGATGTTPIKTPRKGGGQSDGAKSAKALLGLCVVAVGLVQRAAKSPTSENLSLASIAVRNVESSTYGPGITFPVEGVNYNRERFLSVLHRTNDRGTMMKTLGKVYRDSQG